MPSRVSQAAPIVDAGLVNNGDRLLASSSSETESERVLIVDDNEINRKVLSAMLRKEHYQLLVAADGEEALRIARQERPDIVLLDIMMPGMDGYQVCEELKRGAQTVHVPVIFLSALSETGDKIKGLELGAVDYITKPFDKGEVLARVHNQLKIRLLTRELLLANQDLRKKQAYLDEDLKAAAAIQRSLMRPGPLPLDTLQIAWQFMPCDEVGGDIFNFYLLDDCHLAVYMVDVSGHGVPAAMVTVSVSQTLSPQGGLLITPGGADFPNSRITPPAEVLTFLDNEYPFERFEKHFTIAYLLLDCREGHVRYSLGGHSQPVIVRTDGAVELLYAGGTIIGLGGVVPFEEGQSVLSPGDRLFVYTDGIPEFENATGERFGEERFYQQVGALRGEPLCTVCDRVVGSLMAYGGGRKPADDVTLLAIEFQGGK